ncbi:hypothetical protein [Cohnella sp. WQ 127256]|uniref:hypothetical protein n=1 Tax=Cohnella sp. WQ 127256 TaxID=2938790 RepID=UPI0021175B77|nr:hypothetical protein [Cohnella sp. WQ 127256]
MNYREINQNSEEGFQDLRFDIVSSYYKDNRNHFLVYGQYQDVIVGFEVIINSDMLLGWDQGDINMDAFCPEGITLRSIGKESDDFIKVLLELYGFVGELSFEDEISFTSFPLEGDPRNFANEDLKFKVFFDENNELHMYCELYINISVKNRLFELKEKDIEYRLNILKTIGR